MNRFVRVAFLSVVLLVSGHTVLAQVESGQVSGVITDPSGGVVVGAVVSAKDADRGIDRSATTNGSGSYVLTNLPIGTYQLTVEATGLAKVTRQIEITIGARLGLDFKLEVGTQNTVVEVVGQDALQINTENQEISQVVSQKEIVDLPTIDRNPYALVYLSGNVSADPGGNNFGYSLNGQRSASVSVLLDGGENVNTFSATVGQTVPLDAVAEFRVITNNFGAEYGRASGGVVNVATKSGTNEFHGSVYEFNRVSALAANTFDNNANDIPKSVFTKNQFGYSVGGPILKEKLFFFSSTEWTRTRSVASNQAVIFDPALVASGNPNISPALEQFFTAYAAGGLVPGVKTLQQYHVSDLAGVGANPIIPGPFTSSIPGDPVIFDRIVYQANADVGAGSPENAFATVFRVDYNLSSKTSIYARFADSHQNFLPGAVSNYGSSNSPYAGYNLTSAYDNLSGILSLNHAHSSSLFSSFKLEVIRLNETDPPPSAGIVPTLELSQIGNFFAGQNVVVPGNGSGAGVFGGPQNTIEGTGSLTWNRGPHQFNFGGAYIYEQDNREFGAYQSATEYGYLNYDNGLGLDNLLQGQITRYIVAINPQGKLPCQANPDGSLGNTDANGNSCALNLPAVAPIFSRSNIFNDGSLYAQDTWKVRRRLTLNLGLRWEYFGVQHDRDPNLDSNFYLGSGTNIYQQISNGQVEIASKSPAGGLWKPNYKNFAPRVGFAWDVLGDGKTAVRGGYGISYERNYGNVTFNVIQNPPNNATIDATFGPGQDFANPLPIQVNNYGPLSGSGSIGFAPPELRAINSNIKTAYAEFYGLSLDRQVGRESFVSVAYSGSHGVNLYSIENINEPGSGVVYLGSDPTINPYDPLNRSYGFINYRTNDGFSLYNALLVKFQAQDLFHWGLNLNANYTFAHSIDNLSQTFSSETSANGLGFLDPFQPNLDKGDSDYDVRHRVVISAVWDVPLGKSSNGWQKQVIGGWQFAPIFTARTGNPFTAYDCTNAYAYNCPRLVPTNFFNGAISTSTSTPNPGVPNQWIYTTLPAATAYAEPLTGDGALPTCSTTTNSAGNTISTGQNCQFPSTMFGRNTLRQPGVYNLDLGIYKKFTLTERFQLQFRGEFYDFLNHSNFYLDNSAFADVSPYGGAPAPVIGYRGGQGSGGDRRFVQLGLKLLF